MPNQMMPYGFANQSFMPENGFNPFMNQDYNKINELEQRISILEQKIKNFEEVSLPKTSYDYKTSMNMM